MQDNNERTIKHYRLSLIENLRIPNAPYSDHVNLDEALSALKKENILSVTYGGGANKSAFTLKAINETEDGWELLINLIKTGSKAPVKNKLDGTNRQEIDLDDENGLEKSTHIYISKNSEARLGSLALIESTEGIAVAKIVQTLNCFIRENKVLSEKVKSNPTAPDSVEQYKCFYKINYEAVVSGDLVAEIASGNWLDTTITTYGTEALKQAPDNNHNLPIEKIDLKIETINSIDKNKIASYIEKAKKFALFFGGNKLRIRFKNASGAIHTATLNPETGNLCDGSVFVKKTKISDLVNAKKDSYEKINKEIMSKIKECL